MDTTNPNPVIENDVLHLGSATKLSPEQIAKAIAHHNRHHGGNAQQAASTQQAGKKQKAAKGK